jgi:hypothetical protein
MAFLALAGRSRGLTACGSLVPALARAFAYIGSTLLALLHAVLLHLLALLAQTQALLALFLVLLAQALVFLTQLLLLLAQLLVLGAQLLLVTLQLLVSILKLLARFLAGRVSSKRGGGRCSKEHRQQTDCEFHKRTPPVRNLP